MATQTMVSLIDDIDGRKADETVAFALDGAAYEIDLSKKNAAALREVVAGFAAAARHVKPASPVRGATQRAAIRALTKGLGGEEQRRREVKVIREWAERTGLRPAKRGRLIATVVQQYWAAQSR